MLMKIFNKLKVIALIAFFLAFLPFTVLAQGATNNACQLPSNANFADFANVIVCLVNAGFVPMLFAIALGFFVWGVWQYMLGNVDDGSREKGKQYMIWGIIALAVMLTVFQLVEIFGNTFGFEIEGSIVPSLPE